MEKEKSILHRYEDEPVENFRRFLDLWNTVMWNKFEREEREKNELQNLHDSKKDKTKRQ